MSVLFIAIPVALLLASVSVVAFLLQLKRGQFDDLETPPQRMLFDDIPLNQGTGLRHEQVPKRADRSSGDD